MSKPVSPKSLEAWIAYYLYKHSIRLEQHTFDHHYARLARDKFSREIAKDIYSNKDKIFDFNTTQYNDWHIMNASDDVPYGDPEK